MSKFYLLENICYDDGSKMRPFNLQSTFSEKLACVLDTGYVCLPCAKVTSTMKGSLI